MTFWLRVTGIIFVVQFIYNHYIRHHFWHFSTLSCSSLRIFVSQNKNTQLWKIMPRIWNIISSSLNKVINLNQSCAKWPKVALFWEDQAGLQGEPNTLVLLCTDRWYGTQLINWHTYCVLIYILHFVLFQIGII